MRRIQHEVRVSSKASELAVTQTASKRWIKKEAIEVVIAAAREGRLPHYYQQLYDQGKLAVA